MRREIGEDAEQLEPGREAIELEQAPESRGDGRNDYAAKMKATGRAKEEIFERSKLYESAEIRRDHFGAKLNDDGPVFARVASGRAVGRPRVGQVGAEENEIARAVAFDVIAHEALAAAPLDVGEFELGMVVPVEIETRIDPLVGDEGRGAIEWPGWFELGLHARRARKVLAFAR